YLSVPPLEGESVHVRISYRAEGAMKLRTFELQRTETVGDVMDSLQTQFDNMTDLIKLLTAQRHADERSVAFERTRRIQTRLVNAMELLDWSADEYDALHVRAGEIVYTPRSG
ncbi:MAG: hypothetical protein JKY37_17920, partial [Nannocystaceae bacterium]|nr:hypothetical protein [Nannocystaceae bacterium]